MKVAAHPASPLWRFPLETASQSEGGFERTYQGSVLVPIFRRVPLGPDRPFEAELTVEIDAL